MIWVRILEPDLTTGRWFGQLEAPPVVGQLIRIDDGPARKVKTIGLALKTMPAELDYVDVVLE